MRSTFQFLLYYAVYVLRIYAVYLTKNSCTIKIEKIVTLAHRNDLKVISRLQVFVDHILNWYQIFNVYVFDHFPMVHNLSELF